MTTAREACVQKRGITSDKVRATKKGHDEDEVNATVLYFHPRLLEFTPFDQSCNVPASTLGLSFFLLLQNAQSLDS